MKKKIWVTLCAGVLALNCLCGCNGGAAGEEKGTGESQVAVSDKGKKEIADPDFTGVVDGIQYEIYYDKSLTTGAMAIFLTNTEAEPVAFETEMIFYGEDGQVMETIDFDDGLLESNEPYITGTLMDTLALISKVDVSFIKSYASGETYGRDCVELETEFDGKVVKGKIKNVSEDMEIYWPDIRMLFFKDGEFVRFRVEDVEVTENAYKLMPGEVYVFEHEVDVEADTVKCYMQSDSASKVVE